MGAEVIVNGRDKAAVGEAVAKVQQAAPSAKVHAAAFDLGNAAGCAALVEQFPDVDILVNNLGIYEPKGFFDIEDADWTKMFEVNVMSGVRLTRHYLKRMLDNKDWGRVVFVSSESGVYIPKEMVHYGFSKSAQLVIARGAAETTKGTNVTVNSVMPGPTWVEMAPVRLAARAEAAGTTVDDLVSAHLHRTPAGVAAAALRHAGRGRQSDLLRLLKSLQRHQRRRASRRRRDCHEPVLMICDLASSEASSSARLEERSSSRNRWSEWTIDRRTWFRRRRSDALPHERGEVRAVTQCLTRLLR